ncbi:hypothetical protein EVAR_66580_1 [Eumeta japonica]|uniref:Uncharacterized protein n=1 Tax=Eumeta variegata TaxID=151549 RepID=A0A4C1Z742_EUMVA|nr:hypothetical protein EVAR_66580_1 [Eumeta japonica]
MRGKVAHSLLMLHTTLNKVLLILQNRYLINFKNEHNIINTYEYLSTHTPTKTLHHTKRFYMGQYYERRHRTTHREKFLTPTSQTKALTLLFLGRGPARSALLAVPLHLQSPRRSLGRIPAEGLPVFSRFNRTESVSRILRRATLPAFKLSMFKYPEANSLARAGRPPASAFSLFNEIKSERIEFLTPRRPEYMNLNKRKNHFRV